MQETGEHPIDAADPVAPGLDTDNQTSSQDDVQGLREKLERFERQNEQLQDQHELFKRLLMRQQQPSSPPREEENDEEEPSDPNEYVTNRQQSKLVRQFQAKIEQMEQQNQSQLRVQKTKADESALNAENGDYYKLVRQYGSRAYQEDPDLQDEVNLMLQTGKNAASYLYKRIKQSKAYLEDHKSKRQSDAAQAVAKNAERAPSLSQMGRSGQAAGADYWKKMPSKDFNTIVAQVCNGTN